MDKRGELPSTLRIEDVPTVRSMVAQKLREAIMSGKLKPGQRLVERELCKMTGVSRPFARRCGCWKPMASSIPSLTAARSSAPSASRKQNNYTRRAPCWKALPDANAPACAIPPWFAGSAMR
jgi:hypothetical protein